MVYKASTNCLSENNTKREFLVSIFLLIFVRVFHHFAEKNDLFGHFKVFLSFLYNGKLNLLAIIFVLSIFSAKILGVSLNKLFVYFFVSVIIR